MAGLRAAGFEGASKPIGIEPDGRERLEFIEGDVPLPPYPKWARTDEELASVARMCVPIDDSVNAARLGWPDQDLRGRLRLVADTYGLEAADRANLLRILDRSIEMAGIERFDRRRRWWSAERLAFAVAMR